MLQDLELLPAQARAIRLRCRELLVAAEPRSGASHLLRIMALVRAHGTPDQAVLLAGADAQRVREDHLEGETGLWSLLADAAAAGAVAWQPGGLVRFPNGSSIQVTTWDVANRRHPDVLLLDHGEDLDGGLYLKLRERTFSEPSSTAFPRLVVASHRPDIGWCREHWAAGQERERVELRHAALPAPLREKLPPSPAAPDEPSTPAAAGSLSPFRRHAELTQPTLQWAKHVEVMAGAIERLFDGTLPLGSQDRLFIAAPPQSGKSTITQLATSYWLRRNPSLWAGLSAYNHRYARRNSRLIRRFYRNSGGAIYRGAWSVDEWQLPEGGGLWAVGVGGGTGNPANLLMSDDLVKGAKEADSELRQEAAIEWRDSSWKIRWNPYGGRLIEMMIGTRWGTKDVQASALAEGGWHCVILPGLMPHEPIEVPPGNTLEPDWRQPGEALCEDLPKLNKIDLLKMRDGIGPERRGAMKARRFAALIQQQPRPEEGGGIFKDWWFPVLAVDPALMADPATGQPVGDSLYAAEARCWDLAATRGGGDATTCLRAGRRKDNDRVVFRHAQAIHDSAQGVKRRIAEMMIQDGPRVIVGIPVDPGQAGRFQISEMTAYLRAYAKERGVPCAPVRALSTSASKVVRATPYKNAAEPTLENPKGVAEIPGTIDLVAGLWVTEFKEQHHNFDGQEGKADDFVDVAADAYSLVAGSSSGMGELFMVVNGEVVS